MSKEDFKILSARDHVRMRTGMYLGSTALEQQGRFVLGIWREVSFVPALLKMVDEILDNSIDEAIRTEFKHANEISVNVQTQPIVTVRDNGRGIPHWTRSLTPRPAKRCCALRQHGLVFVQAPASTMTV
jgi:DNA gyrase/topoisomerase IV subunit B